MAWLVLSPLLALAYFATEEGEEFADSATVSVWADPARDLAGGLLTFAASDRVYATYLQALALFFPAVLLAALVARSRRPRAAIGRLERWGWRAAVAGYGVATVGILAAAIVTVPGSASSDALNAVFLALMVPGTLISVLGSSFLGIALVRARYRLRLTAWLLALAVPLFVLGGVVLGHNSLGFMPLLVAWGATGWRLSRTEVGPAVQAAVEAR